MELYPSTAPASCGAGGALSCDRAPPRPVAGNPADTRMADGRHFTDWTPRGSGWMAGALYPHPSAAGDTSAGPPPSSHDMKDRLIKHGTALMDADRAAAAATVSRTWCDALGALPGFEAEQECGEFACSFAAPRIPRGGAPGTGLGRR